MTCSGSLAPKGYHLRGRFEASVRLVFAAVGVLFPACSVRWGSGLGSTSLCSAPHPSKLSYRDPAMPRPLTCSIQPVSLLLLPTLDPVIDRKEEVDHLGNDDDMVLYLHLGFEHPADEHSLYATVHCVASALPIDQRKARLGLLYL